MRFRPVLISTLLAGFMTHTSAAYPLYLYDHARAKAIKSADKLKPERIYFKYIKNLELWAIVKTEADGKLARPSEIMGVGSVIPGSWIGAKNKDERFIITPAGSFETTQENTRIHSLVFGKTITVKTLSYQPELFLRVKAARLTPKRSP